MGVSSFATENYLIWGPKGTTRSTLKNLMSRPALEHWLYGHLLKICLPRVRPPHSDRPMYAPLNLNAFFHLISAMHEVGYPTHWLSGILSAACEGSISTTARPPRQLVLNTKDVDKTHASRKISLRPWLAEFTTLLSVWSRLLPFGVAARLGTFASPTKSASAASSFLTCQVTMAGHHTSPSSSSGGKY